MHRRRSRGRGGFSVRKVSKRRGAKINHNAGQRF